MTSKIDNTAREGLDQKHLAEIKNLSHDGRGVAKLAGKTVFIEGGLPGETVNFTYYKRKPRYDLGRVMEVLKPSPDRVAPLCPHFGLCGGCALQHMTQASQLAMKQALLLKDLEHFAGVLPQEILPPIQAAPFHYRRRARLGVKYVAKKEKLLVGFREKNSHKVADLSRCETLHPWGGERFAVLQELIAGLDAYAAIPQIEIAIAEKLTALIFRHLKPLSPLDEEKLTAFAKGQGIALYLQPEGLDSIHLLWGPAEGVLDYSLPEYNVHIQFQSTDFTQVNWDINPLMVRAALTQLDPQPTETILDLFCGLGNFTLPLARYAGKVVGVEGSSSLVASAFQNAARNHITNVAFYAVDLSKPLPSEVELDQKYDKILLDPPRTGALELMDKIPRWDPATIVYVSCNPATLARDIGILVKKSPYRLISAGIMDMFPQTMHVESMAVLKRN